MNTKFHTKFKKSGVIWGLVGLGLGCTSLAPMGLRASTTLPELVVSIPVETDLEIDGVSQTSEVWIREIRAAQKSIELAQMYIAHREGESLAAILQELTTAGKRGVKIRVLLAQHMLGNDPAALKTLESIPGLEVRPIDYSKSTGGILHAKFWIFDAERAFVGSQNFDWRALDQIQETGILFEDRAEVQKLARIFEYDWLLNDPKQTTPPQTELPTDQEPSPLPELEVLASPPRHFPVTPRGERPIRSSLAVLLDALSRARTKIQLQFLNMSPLDRSGGYWHELDVALRAAATRGVKVEILLSHWSTRAPDIDHLKSLSLLPNMSLRFLTVPEHSRGFEPYSRVIHSKLLVVDDHTAWVGTSNGSKSYFTNSRNIEVLLRAPKMVQTVRRVFEKGWNSKHTSPIDVSRSYPNPRVSL